MAQFTRNDRMPTMTMQLVKRATVAEFGHETSIIRHLSTGGPDAVLSHVQTVDHDQDPTITPDDRERTPRPALKSSANLPARGLCSHERKCGGSWSP